MYKYYRFFYYDFVDWLTVTISQLYAVIYCIKHLHFWTFIVEILTAINCVEQSRCTAVNCIKHQHCLEFK